MAARTIFTKLSVMLILVTGDAVARKTEIRVIEVLDNEPCARRRWNELCLVALFARDATVFSGECEPRLTVIDGLALRIPVNQGEINAVVIRVTPSALFAVYRISAYPKIVHAALLGKPFTDICMALKAFELLSTSAQAMTFGAVCRS